MSLTIECGPISNDIDRTILALRSKATRIRLKMREIWRSEDSMSRLEEYQKLNEKLRETNIYIAEFEYRKYLL